MSVSSVLCCYRDCGRAVWETRADALCVVASSGTCIDCRRVVLCLEHLERVREARGDAACPGCAGRRWHAVVFEPAFLSPERRREIELAGGRVEVRLVPAASVHRIAVARPTATPSDPPRRPLPAGLMLIRAGGGRRTLVPGLVADGDGRVLRLDPGRSLRLDAPARSAAVTEGGAVAVTDDLGRLFWFTRDDRALHLPNPHGGACDGASFVDEEQLAYLADLPDGRSEVRISRRTSADRAECRRVGAAFDSLPGIAPVVIDGGRTLIALRRTPEGFAQPFAIDLMSGETTDLDTQQLTPRRLAGARRSPLACWISADGRVRCAGPGRAAMTLGHSDADSLAVAPDGSSVAWRLGGEIVVGGAQGEAPVRHPSPSDLVGLDWR